MIYAWLPKPGKSPRGCGKTGGMTAHLKADKEAGRKILTNYGTTFKDGDIRASVLAAMPEDLKNLSMGADEVHTILESRRGMSTVQIQITYMILQTRKRKVDFHYTTHGFHQVEKRLVQQTDIVIYCENLGCGDMECTGQLCGIETCGIFHYEVYDNHTGEWLGEYWLNGPKDFYNLYDSEEAITDFTVNMGADGQPKAAPERTKRPKVEL